MILEIYSSNIADATFHHPEPVTDDDEFSEFRISMFIFQIPRLVRNWNFEQKNQTFQKMQTMVLLKPCFFTMLAFRMDRKFFWFPPYFFPLFYCRKVKFRKFVQIAAQNLPMFTK